MFKLLSRVTNKVVSKFRDDMLNDELKRNKFVTMIPVKTKARDGGVLFGMMDGDRFKDFYNMPEDKKLEKYPFDDGVMNNRKLYECYDAIVSEYTEKAYAVLTLIIAITSLFISLFSIIIAILALLI